MFDIEGLQRTVYELEQRISSLESSEESKNQSQHHVQWQLDKLHVKYDRILRALRLMADFEDPA